MAEAVYLVEVTIKFIAAPPITVLIEKDRRVDLDESWVTVTEYRAQGWRPITMYPASEIKSIQFGYATVPNV